MKKTPAFVRGMVVTAVEESCRKNGLDRVTVEELDRIRSRMPTQRSSVRLRNSRAKGKAEERLRSPPVWRYPCSRDTAEED